MNEKSPFIYSSRINKNCTNDVLEILTSNKPDEAFYLNAILDKLNVIAYRPMLASITGDVISAIFLAQAMYWQARTPASRDWFYKNAKEWEAETAITESSQKTARKKLIEKNILYEEDPKSTNRSKIYRVDLNRVAELLKNELIKYYNTPPIVKKSDSSRHNKPLQIKESAYCNSENICNNTETTSRPSNTTTQNDSDANVKNLDTENCSSNIIYPNLEPEIIDKMKVHMNECPYEYQQAVIDELAGRLRDVNQLGPVPNPIGYLRGLISSVINGKFNPERGLTIKQQREQFNKQQEFIFAEKEKNKKLKKDAQQKSDAIQNKLLELSDNELTSLEKKFELKININPMLKEQYRSKGMKSKFIQSEWCRFLEDELSLFAGGLNVPKYG